MIRKIPLLLFFISGMVALPICGNAQGKNNLCKVVVKFIHTANGKPVIKNDSTYITPNGEPYSISKLKYYISGFSPGKKGTATYLIDAFGTDSFSILVPRGNYNTLSFLLGVDSLKNCSGAQDGALDPLNDMFWTWNSGYVMFKLEGNSDSSHADLKRIEHHIGGYKGANKTMRIVNIATKKPFSVTPDKKTTLVLELNLDRYWNNISIGQMPVIVTPGSSALQSADNFPYMFSLKNSIRQ